MSIQVYEGDGIPPRAELRVKPTPAMLDAAREVWNHRPVICMPTNEEEPLEACLARTALSEEDVRRCRSALDLLYQRVNQTHGIRTAGLRLHLVFQLDRLVQGFAAMASEY